MMKKILLFTFVILLTALTGCSNAAQTPKKTRETKAVTTFKNPVSYKSMPDPYIIYHDGYYYGLATEAVRVKIYKSKRVENLFSSKETKTVIRTGDDIGHGLKLGGNVWAPELHYIPSEGKWYVYACAGMNGNVFSSIRMFCLESEDGDPFGKYTFKGITYNKLCIDQTVFYDDESGRLYTAYSEFTQDKGQVITIAEMTKPWKVGEKRVTVTCPEYGWEKRGADASRDSRVNEGPIFLKHDGRIFLIYSASGCWSEWYCLGMLEYTGKNSKAENFLNPDNWQKREKPVFEEGNGVYGTGHCSFFTSPDGKETWMAYHGMATPDAGENGRYAYVQKIDFSADGLPVLGEPLPRGTAINVPSGQE